MTRSVRTLDDFASLAGWQAIAPGDARLELRVVPGPRGHALCLDYDLGGNGFVIARRPLDLALPEDYAFTLETRGEGPARIVEFKLVDETLGNVWRLRDEHFVYHRDWTPWRIAAQDIEYAWGARRQNVLAHADALEIAVVGSGPGRLWLAELALEDLSQRGSPRVTASSAAPGRDAARVLNGDDGWLSAAGGKQSLTLEFDMPRALGALGIHWDAAAPPAIFQLAARDVDGAWRTLRAVDAPPAAHSLLLLPGLRATALRLECVAAGAACGIARLELHPWHYARTLLDGLTSRALAAPRGDYPKPLMEQQSYWTVTAPAAGGGIALINTEGLVEMPGAACAVEAFLRLDERFLTWADVALERSLPEDGVPLPTVRWQAVDASLDIAPLAAAREGHTQCDIEYRVTNHGARSRDVTLYVAARPYLVTPAWQIHHGVGGVARLERLALNGARLDLGAAGSLTALTAPTAAGVQGDAQGALVSELRAARLPTATEVSDPDGLASGVFACRFSLAPGASASVRCAWLPAGAHTAPQPIDAQAVAEQWRAQLPPCALELPPTGGALASTLRAAAAHILVNRDGPRLQPGPRRYIRAYLRDAVGMGTALARLGAVAPLRDFLDYYRAFQREDGELPDCVDDHGPEWLPEFDAYGQYLHGVAEAERYAPDPAFRARQAPHVAGALAKFEALRATRLDAAFDTDGLRARRGLLPESMSHEGYMAQPVHAYWDDFWALRGLHDAAWLAASGGDAREAACRDALARAFAADLHTSLELTMAQHGIDFLPGSVELGDFDATALAVALSVADDGHALPRAALDATFDRYLAIRAERAHSDTWSNYSAYEIRIVGALVRLGRRSDALALLEALLADCRPREWRQWPEQSWREPDAPAFLGDLPHSWIGAEFIQATLALFAHERRADASLVLAAGVAPNWLDNGGITLRDLETHHGRLTYRLWRRDARTVECRIDDPLRVPPGGLVLAPPLPGPLAAVTIDGVAQTEFAPDHCRCMHAPAHLVLTCKENAS